MTPHSLLLVAIAVALSSITAGLDLNTGSCENFAVLASTAVSFNGAKTTVQSGSVGITPGLAITGNYALIDGTNQVKTAAAIACLQDLMTTHKAASAAVCPASNILTDLAGLTLVPGVYCFLSGAITFSASTLTLDALGNPDAQWIFQAASTITTATATSVILKNGAQATNVYWALGTGGSVGYASSFLGNIMANTAITIGSNAQFTGRLLAQTAVTFASGATISLLPITPVAVRQLRIADQSALTTQSTAVPLGACSAFALMAGTAASFNGGLTTVTSGSLGVSPGISVSGVYLLMDGAVKINSNSSNQCAFDRITAYNALAAAVCPPSNIRPELSGLTLFPGVYCSASTISLSATTLTLDGQGDSNAQWIFQAGSGLTTSPYTSIILMNGAQAKNIYWNIGSSATLGYSSAFMGTIVAYASISFDHNSVLIGRGLAGAAVSFASTSTVGLPL